MPLESGVGMGASGWSLFGEYGFGLRNIPGWALTVASRTRAGQKSTTGARTLEGGRFSGWFREAFPGGCAKDYNESRNASGGEA